MKMLEAFKRLLDGEKITRPDWDGYVKYDKEDNTFKRYDGSEFRSFGLVTFWNNSKGSGIRLSDSVGEWVYTDLLNDDKNEIWESPQERMQLDAMRWRLARYCKARPCTTEDCALCMPGISCKVFYMHDLMSMPPEEVKRLYDLIKEDN